MHSIFVTGTDTDAGKTVISAAIIEKLKQQGLRVAGMKPVASGSDLTKHGLRNDDAIKLMTAANVELPYDVVNPYTFAPAIAPHIAADQVNISVELTELKRCFNLIQQQADAVVVEGAGGWFVPLNQQHMIADFAVSLQLPVVLVVGIKLGCINHALLSINAIKQSGLTIRGWVANSVEPSEQAAEIIATLKQHIEAPCLGEVPVLQDKHDAARYLNLEID